MKSFDKLLFLTIIISSLFGIIMIYSASSIWASYKFNDSFKFVKNQLLFFIIGYIIMIFISKIDLKKVFKYTNKLLIISVILLILVLIPGIGSVRNGSRSWFGIGSFGIQPSEAVKLILTIYASRYLTLNEASIKKLSGIIPLLIITFLIFLLIMLQPDFGTGVIIVMSIIGMLFIAGANLKFFIYLIIFGIFGVIGLIVIAPYRLNRIVSFINPWSDPLGSGFQIIQSLYAIGPSGLFGYGFLNSRQKHFYLPEPQTDFIFSIIAEEFGFLGIIIISILFLTIIYKGFNIARKSNNLFYKYLSFGITFELAFQITLNLMVVVGLIPVTGVTLPFFSYGGSSLLITLVSMGVILNISRNNS